MINKRLLIKTLLKYTDENSFYDKKEKLNLDNRVGKARFLKHICSLSNSNPRNNSFIVVGVTDQENMLKGVDFFDDSKIQNLVNAYLENPPLIQYENVYFSILPKHKVIGLVTIRSQENTTYFKRSIWKYPSGTMFYRIGSNSTMSQTEKNISNQNHKIVEEIEKAARNNIEHILDNVFSFFNQHSEEFNPQYKVFKEQFIICWAGKKNTINDEEFYSRVNIELINEQVRLFYSSLDLVTFSIGKEVFIITEHINLGLKDDLKYYPLEKTILHFKDNGKLKIAKEVLFEPPIYDKHLLHHIYNNNNSILQKLQKKTKLTNLEQKDLEKFPITYTICALNNFLNAKTKLEASKEYLKNLDNKIPYIQFKEAKRLFRKLKYA
ncbi:ATP-binding protein [Aureivirga sp. CE67]|uniref:ATP-binding protein n=1 Tax=Aureivirga sp. CE67 TaxID=1788983 RepID=UPI0018CB04EB|nr:ATP-binding protein [Aureivirga sp. CE67]